ncbi:MAG TPA: hypothetical protein VEX68_01935 [Bryobacteraceae bacterium]|nr:hypothetical protein [Bryobacteraceae bacterium]
MNHRLPRWPPDDSTLVSLNENGRDGATFVHWRYSFSMQAYMHQVHRAVGVAILCVASVSASGGAFAALRAGPKPVMDPRQGDGGVSSFYLWEKSVPNVPRSTTA